MQEKVEANPLRTLICRPIIPACRLNIELLLYNNTISFLIRILKSLHIRRPNMQQEYQ